jgi:hypothetical protein
LLKPRLVPHHKRLNAALQSSTALLNLPAGDAMTAGLTKARIHQVSERRLHGRDRATVRFVAMHGIKKIVESQVIGQQMNQMFTHL